MFRKEHNRKGEAMIMDDFQVKFVSALKWELWETELFEEIATHITTTRANQSVLLECLNSTGFREPVVTG